MPLQSNRLFIGMQCSIHNVPNMWDKMAQALNPITYAKIMGQELEVLTYNSSLVERIETKSRDGTISPRKSSKESQIAFYDLSKKPLTNTAEPCQKGCSAKRIRFSVSISKSKAISQTSILSPPPLISPLSSVTLFPPRLPLQKPEPL